VASPSPRASAPARLRDSTLAEPAPEKGLLGKLLALLDLGADDLVVQLGCGFPHLRALVELVPLRHQVLVIDPSAERLEPFAGTPLLRPVAMDALDFVAYPMQCDRILIDDTVLCPESAFVLARGLFARLRPAGRLLAAAVAAPADAPRPTSRVPA
jgi:hypothetical protein